jgi:hypothetical protein
MPRHGGIGKIQTSVLFKRLESYDSASRSAFVDHHRRAQRDGVNHALEQMLQIKSDRQ